MNAVAMIQPTPAEESIYHLRRLMPTGQVVCTVLRSVSRSGLRREIGVVVWDTESRCPIHLNWHVSRALGLRCGKSGGVIIDGCGMDMGFDLVDRLARVLHGDDRSLTQIWI